MKMRFHGCAPRLALRKRLKVIRKWPIDQHDNSTRAVSDAVSRDYRDRGHVENPDCAKNQSDCRIRYRVLLGKKKCSL